MHGAYADPTGKPDIAPLDTDVLLSLRIALNATEAELAANPESPYCRDKAIGAHLEYVTAAVKRANRVCSLCGVPTPEFPLTQGEFV